METGLDRENAQEFIFTHNQNNIFALVHDLGDERNHYQEAADFYGAGINF